MAFAYLSVATLCGAVLELHNTQWILKTLHEGKECKISHLYIFDGMFFSRLNEKYY